MAWIVFHSLLFQASSGNLGMIPLEKHGTAVYMYVPAYLPPYFSLSRDTYFKELAHVIVEA